MGALDLRELPLDAQLPDPPEDGGAALTERDHIEAAAGMAIARVRLGAMEAVDATVREALSPRHAFAVVAELINALPCGRYTHLLLGSSREAVEALVAAGGERQTLVSTLHGTATEVAGLKLGRLEIRARCESRDATPEELAEQERREAEAAELLGSVLS